MSDADETFEVNGYTIKIYQDTKQGAGDPRDADNLGVMLANGHRNYTLGDEEYKGHIPEYDLAARIVEEHAGHRGGRIDGAALIEAFKAQLGATVVLPLWLLDHSGLAMRTGPFMEDPGKWDSGIVGFIFDTPRTREMCGTPLDRIEEVLRSEVEEYDKYLQGDVWGYVIEDPCGVKVESCWGFLGFDYIKDEAKSAAEHLPKPLIESDLTDEEHEALGELVHDTASEIASNAVNEGKGLEYLVTNGWSLEDVRGRLDEMTLTSQEPDTDDAPPVRRASDDPEYDEAEQQEAEQQEAAEYENNENEEVGYSCCCSRRFAKRFGMRVHQRTCRIDQARRTAVHAALVDGKPLSEVKRDEQAAIDAALKVEEAP